MTADVGQSPAPDASLRPAAEGAESAEAKRNAFANVPASDYVTDGLAVILLLVSLSLPWAAKDATIGTAGDVAWVLPVTLLSVLALALPYLARFGVLPSTWTVHSTRKVRIWANLPYLVAVVVHLVLDGAGLAGYQGIGTAAALGLAGAVLSATPRRCELGPVGTDHGASALWWKLSVGFAVAMAVLILTWIALFSVEFFKLSSISTAGGIKTYILVVVEALAVGFLILAPALLTISGRSVAWRNVTTTLGVVVTVVFFMGGPEQVALETLQSAVGRDLLAATGAGVVLVPAVAAILASPAVSRALRQQHEVTNWLTTGNAALRYIAITSGVLIVVSAVALVNGLALAAGITAIVLLLVTLVLSLVADKAMLKNIAEGRRVALVVAGVTAILGLCLLATSPVAPLLRWLGSDSALTWAHVLLALGLPLLTFIALTGPASVREFFVKNALAPKASRTRAYEWQEPAAPALAPAAASGHGQYGQAPTAQQRDDEPAQVPAQAPAQAGHVPFSEPAVYDQTAPPVEPVHEQRVEEPIALQNPAAELDPAHAQTSAITDRLDVRDISSGFTPEIAADPATPAAVLAQIVEEAPHLRPDVAVNPATYPALLDWLRELGDPAVDEALRSREQ